MSSGPATECLMRLSIPAREVVEIMSRNLARAVTETHARVAGPDLIQENHKLLAHFMNTLDFCMQEVYTCWAILWVTRLRRGFRGVTLRYDGWVPGRELCYSGSMQTGHLPFEIQPHAPRGWWDLLGAGR